MGMDFVGQIRVVLVHSLVSLRYGGTFLLVTCYFSFVYRRFEMYFNLFIMNDMRNQVENELILVVK